MLDVNLTLLRPVSSDSISNGFWNTCIICSKNGTMQLVLMSCVYCLEVLNKLFQNSRVALSACQMALFVTQMLLMGTEENVRNDI